MNHRSATPHALLALAGAIAFVALATPNVLAGDQSDSRSREELVDLSGNWRFTVGDDVSWGKEDFDDHRWSRIEVPGYWENEGYDDYNGFAWYRRTFTFGDDAGLPTYLLLGQIDDADEVYLNGKLIGRTGSFPPNYLGSWNKDRAYPVPAGSLKEGRNVIAVRVYDGASGGGIVGHPIGVYTSNIPLPEIDLTGIWKFRAGDNPGYKDPRTDDSKFTTIHAPSYWESAGQGNLDGFGWYRKTFGAVPHARDKTMVLMLGKIDDSDEVYLNGTKIGSTGNLNDSDRHSGVGYYAQNRGYYFPASLLKDENLLAVRVYDHGERGGIYEGPLGIISQERYIEYWELIRHDRRRHHSARGVLRFLFGDNN